MVLVTAESNAKDDKEKDNLVLDCFTGSNAVLHV
eukprot:CAMPEP_0172456596 /NCGR_PEP_ID=MMETSP1065-20121228/16406_1 /TAXON_ID=265537 /ORGANISM="Amphiprora paludosa, Strain CCMP125" /LENGTH=33 /DNA_ID= /DNA_START= /DNA_END= /DNA_ORIENTATION=